MIEFYCENCGQKINAPDIYSGEKGQCPKCKNTLVVPDTSSTESAPRPSPPSKPPVSLRYSDYELTLLNVQEQSAIKGLELSQNDDSEKEADYNKRQEEKQKEAEQAEERKFPWFIDILLYPTSLPGLKHLAIFAGIPCLMGILGSILPGQLSCLFGLITLAINILIFLYLFWYLAECIRDSADGWVRAPQGMGALPDMSDMFRQLINTIGCLAFFLMPFGIYIIFTGRIDIFALLLLIAAIFFYPIGFLSVILFDSVSGLKPRVLLRSIGNTFLPYLGLVLLFVFIVWLTGIVFIEIHASLFWELVMRFLTLYAAFILAHLTGRFYWRYQEKLKWNLESLRERQSYD